MECRLGNIRFDVISISLSHRLRIIRMKLVCEFSTDGGREGKWKVETSGTCTWRFEDGEKYLPEGGPEMGEMS